MRSNWIGEKGGRRADWVENLRQSAAGERFPLEMETVLMEASLLYYVPFSWLVPDHAMLPEETLQFFTVDYNWVLSHLDGICSIGRNAGIDYSHDTELLREIYRDVLRGSGRIRQEKIVSCKAGREKGRAEEENGAEASGFILRSAVTVDFRGIEIRAYADGEGKRRLQPLRIEMVGPQIMAGIFAGRIHRLELVQPPEGLHYGAVKSGGETYKRLRDMQTGKIVKDIVPLTFRENSGSDTSGAGSRVVDVEKLARDMEQKLRRNITSAEIGLQMVQNAQTGVFIMGEKDEDK